MKKIILFLLLTCFAFANLTFDLKNAIKKKDTAKIKDLLEKGAEPDGDAVNLALKNGDYELFTQLIDSGMKVNSWDSDGVPVISIACMYGNKDIVKTLLEKGANIESKDGNGNTPLYAAIKKNNKEIVELLINEGADVNTYSNAMYTPLMYAVSYNANNCIQILLDNGAKIDYGFKEFITTYNPVLVASAKLKRIS